MKLRNFLPLLLAVAGAWHLPAGAVIVEDLFSVELPVADQTTALRLESFSQAFRQVVVKVSGSDDALNSPAFERPIERSARYVKQFRYISREQSEDEDLEASRLYLRIDFDQQLIESLLREHNFPVWGRERPSSLLVISYDVNENIKLVADDSTPDLVEALDRAASVHAVPVLFPLMDLADISLVKISDIVSRQYDNIYTMAKRYAPDALLVGQIIGRSGEGWQGDWEVRFADQIFKWKHRASSKQDVIDQVIRHLARILALEYALEDHRRVEQSLLLSVSALDGIDKLIKVQKYLQSLNAVDSVRVAMVNRDVVTYRLKLRNDPEDLQRLIEFGEVLEQEDFPQLRTQGEEQIILNYSFIDRGVAN
ncbi:MAG: DUF2066 domain-containing protein [Gammaproteobacteria bacterium]|nr:DUF2066 domain-containing protein [Gammaproteobacteria bacterium]MDH3446590.1 DUF2066 domain-containing protein [Gammaproteobacteria bacterium]